MFRKRVIEMFVIAVYDFEQERVSKALKICRKYLTWVQNSVFEGEITEGNFKKLKRELQQVMDSEKDSVIVYTFKSTRYSDKEILGVEKNKESIFL